MKIQIDDKWSIDSDTYCWTLEFSEPTGKTSPTTGEPTFRTQSSYHANLKQAALSYLDKSLIGSKSLEDVLERLSKAEQSVCAALGAK